MAELLVVRSKVKDVAKKKKMRMGEDAVKALSRQVECLIDAAAERAKSNRRGTIQGKDI